MPVQRKHDKALSLRAQGFLLLLGAVFLAISLLSFSSKYPQSNWVGITGHLLGWGFLYLFGFASFFIPVFAGWLGWKFLLKKPPLLLKRRLLFFSLLLFSASILLAMTADSSPSFASLFERWTYAKSYPKNESYDPSNLRHYLGGVPLHHFYRDTFFNLKHALGRFGTFFLCSSLFLASWVALVDLPYPKLGQKLLSFLKKRKNLLLEKRPKPPIRKKPFEEIAELQQLVRENPLKKITKIHFNEKKVLPPSSPKPLPISHASFKDHYTLPPSTLLTEIQPFDASSLKSDLKQKAELLEETLASFGIEAKVGDIHMGPTITSFEVHPAVGVKVQKIKSLENDIALNLQAKSIRIIAPIPGKAAVGIEVPNSNPQEVSFRDLLENYQAASKKAHIPLLLGKVVNGDEVWADLTKMPHLIIAGATGSGKSVCINTIVMSIVMNAHPDEIKLVMVDPKKVELTAYTHLPHMLAPVITEPASATAALVWLVKEMERRYEIFRQLGIRNIHGFNTRKSNKELEESLEIEVPDKLPFIVVIIDELADLMMISASDIETPIARIAQMARAVGIHMILATQRPSREVITGLIKANFPSRIAFKVSSRVNSQIIIDDNGAETLLGNGDMLFLPPGAASLVRAQGAFIRDEDINQVIEHICSQAPTRYLIPSFDNYRESLDELSREDEPKDALFDEAKKIVIETGTASTTFLQRKLKVGYARAASLMDQLEASGIVGPADGAKPRKIYFSQDDA